MSERIHITYRLTTSKNEVQTLARKIAIEQSVEAPESVITDAIEENCVGTIENIECVANSVNSFNLELSYPSSMLSGQFNQLLNLCLGNVSMYQNVRLIDVKIPDDLLVNFSGPQYGVVGIRDELGVYKRPLLATALKPRGESNEYFADLAYQFACGGGDIIKDDQNLISNFDEFKQRVRVCVDAINKARQKTGRLCFYFPFVSASFEEIEKYLEWVKSQGVRGVLMCPLIIGLDMARGLAKKYELMYMAHPAFTGSYCIQSSHGMNYELLYGLLFRLAGVDISVFPNQGGRFSFREQDCKNIANTLHEPLGKIKTSFPCPAGGMQYEDLTTMCDWFGQDSVFLLGGSLLEYSSSITESTKAFRNKIAECFREQTEITVAERHLSSCEINNDIEDQARDYLRFDNFNWEGRESLVYKEANDLPFRGIRRVELIGKAGEKSAFDLRYFEIEALGYSSLERHQHTHVIIGARGSGEVLIDRQSYTVYENDVLYIKPFTNHQLKNIGNSPFGFYCIVDRKRDKPVAPD